mgnify:CR=1 FL=1
MSRSYKLFIINTTPGHEAVTLLPGLFGSDGFEAIGQAYFADNSQGISCEVFGLSRDEGPGIPDAWCINNERDGIQPCEGPNVQYFLGHFQGKESVPAF